MRAQLTADSSYWVFMAPQLVQGLAMGMFFVAMLAVSFDGLPSQKVPAASGLSNFLRITAAGFATSLITTFWDRREALHQSQLADVVTQYSPAYQEVLTRMHQFGLTDQLGRRRHDPDHDRPKLSLVLARPVLCFGMAQRIDDPPVLLGAPALRRAAPRRWPPSSTMIFDWRAGYPSVRLPVFARNVVATSHPLAAQAGLALLQQGGNAVDAAIGAAAAMTILEPCSNGLGSDAFCILWDGHQLHGLNASGRAPAAWSAGLFPEKIWRTDRCSRRCADGIR